MGDKKYGAVIERLREGTKAYEDFTNQMAPPPEGDEPSIWEKLFMPFSSKVRAWDRLQMPTIPSDVVTPPEPTQLPQVAEQPPSDLDKFLSMFGLGKEGQIPSEKVTAPEPTQPPIDEESWFDTVRARLEKLPSAGGLRAPLKEAIRKLEARQTPNVREQLINDVLIPFAQWYANPREIPPQVKKILEAKIPVSREFKRKFGVPESRPIEEISPAEVMESLEPVFFGLPGGVTIRAATGGLKTLGAAAEIAARAEAGMVKLGGEGKFAKELWNAMKIAERNALAKQAGLEGKVGSKAFEKLSASEKTALGKVIPEARIPKAEAGMPEAGLQPSMLPEQVAAKEVFPKGKGVPTQISMDEAAKLETMRLEESLSQMQMELTGLKEWLNTEPAQKLTPIIKKLGAEKGEITNLTLKQYRDITGKTVIKPNILTPDGKHVKWEYALDDVATELGYADSNALKVAIEQAGKGKARIKQLENEIKIGEAGLQKPSPPIPEGAGVVPPVKPPEVVHALNPPSPPEPTGILGNLQDADELVNVMNKPDVYRKIANLPGIKQIMSFLNPSGVAETAPQKAIVARAALREEGTNKVIGAFSRLEAIGSRDKIWGKLSQEGFITEGKLGGLSLDDVLTYRKKWDAYLTPQQRQWARAFHDLEDAKLKLLTDNGIPIKQLSFEEGGEYVGRRVVGRVNSQTGDLTESAFVGAPGPGRPGARMGVEKTRYFKDINEAIDEGYRYLPPDETLFLNLKGAYNRIADKQVADWVLDRVAYRTTGAPEKLVQAALDARTKLWKSRQLEGALNRAVRGERIPGSTINSIANTYPEQAKKLKDLIPSLQEGKPVASRVQSLTAETKALVRQDETAAYRAVNARARAREAAMSPHLGEATVQAPAFAGKILTGKEAEETAKILNKSFSAQYGDIDRIISAANKLNAVGRYFMLAGDASPLLIQLITFPFRFPKIWGKAVGGFTKALFSPKAQAEYLFKNNDIIQKSHNLVLSKGGQTEFTEAFHAGGILQSKWAKAPKAVLEPFQRGFEAALDTAGIELRKAFDYIATTPQRTAEIEQFINEIRGLTSSARIGVSPQMRAAETAVLLAPRYNRAIAALVSDIARGGIRGDQARKALAALLGGGAAIATAITLARGEGWEGVIEHLDIRDSRKFLTWEVGGQNIGPGSKIRSLLVLLGRIIKAPEQTVDHANNFIRGNFSPIVGTGFDVIVGRNFIGEPTRPGKGVTLLEGMLGLSKRVVAENLVPIWVQSMALEGGDIGERLIRGGAEFVGARAYPSPLRGKWAKDLQAYLAIPTNVLERKEQGIKLTRDMYRTKNPEVDAKLFITGQVSSIQTPKALQEVLKLVEENKINPKLIKAVEKWDALVNARRLKTGFKDTLTDKLIKELLK